VNRGDAKRKQANADAAALVELAVLGSRGRSDSRLRKAVVDQAAKLAGRDAPPPRFQVPESLSSVVEKVARHAYRVTDEDIDAVADAGHDENELFDVIVAAALGAGLARRERGLAAISAWEDAR
jgi:hypothetical protein